MHQQSGGHNSPTDHHHHQQHASKALSNGQQRRVSREEAMAIKAEVDYHRLNKSFTDVTFIVGPPQHSKKYVGHRVLLAMTSPVFETMFYGDMADKNKYIRIPDVAPIGFENLLRYAYTDSLNLAAVEDAMLTAYAAKKYLLPQLLRECLTYIEHNIGPQTACVVFEFAQVLNSQQLVLQAMNLIDRQTMGVIGNKSFNHVQASTVEFLANRKYLTLDSELSLFGALLNWSTSEARRRGLPRDDWLGIRSIMRECSLLGAVRLLSLTQEEAARAIAKSSHLSQVGLGAISNGASKQQVTNSKLEANQSLSSVELNSSSNNNSLEQHNSSQLDHEAPKQIDVEDTNCLLNEAEQRAVLLNLALSNIAKLPATLNPSALAREPPPEHFTLRRFRSTSSNLITTTTTTRNIKTISSKFQCLSENVFIVALTIPIRLDLSSYTNRTPKFECHLKFTTRTTSNSSNSAPSATPSTAPITGSPANPSGGGSSGSPLVDQLTSGGDQQQEVLIADGSTLLMDTIDESLHISIARDKDCLVRLKRPILIRLGNINELTLTFQTYALDEDVVALRTPKLRSANFSEQTDSENISWLFFKSSQIEFSEYHYYY